MPSLPESFAAPLPASSLSLGLDAGRLDDRPPLLDLGLLEGGERLRRLHLARRNSWPMLGRAARASPDRPSAATARH